MNFRLENFLDTLEEEEALFLFRQKGLNSLLTKAVLQKDKSAVIQALDKGAGPNIKDANGYTLLHNLVTSDDNRDIEIVKLLISKGANINALDNNNTTPLYTMLSTSSYTQPWDQEKINLVNMILNQPNVNLSTPKDSGYSLIHVAIVSGLYKPMIKCDHEVANVVKKMCDKGVILDSPSAQTTELELALKFEQHNVAKILICNGADRNLVKDQASLYSVGKIMCADEYHYTEHSNELYI